MDEFVIPLINPDMRGAFFIGFKKYQIAWLQFRDRYTEGEKGKGKRYRDWPAHFATAVKDNWFRLWFTDDKGGMCWSSNGMTHKAVLDARAAQQEVEHEPA